MPAQVPGSKMTHCSVYIGKVAGFPTDSIVRKPLKRITRILGWEHKQVTFHTFSSGASWAFQHGVPIDAIKKQGTWSLGCFWRYIHTSSHSPCDSLLHAFKLHLAN